MSAIIHIALGSNRRHGRHGGPARVVAAAIDALAVAGLPVVARSAVRATAPLGPRQRRFANAVVAVATDLPLPTVLARLQRIERDFGRRRGRRWGPRVLDLDIVAAGATATPHWRTARTGLIVPHRGVAVRRFVLDPLVEVGGDWRHPVLHATARQLRARLRRPRRSSVASP
jgi:2-amino-4-hydroxy-6-hydroxymethyldihydropteridine diphosphokinase